MRLGEQATLAAATSACVLAIGLPEHEAPLRAGLAGVAAAALSGVALFSLLARARPPLPPWRRGRRRALTVAVAYLSARSAYEELLWRGLGLALLLDVAHPAAAVALSTGAWAASHARAQGRRAGAHLATGTLFGGLFYAGGSLALPVAAHVSYNLAVCFGIERARAQGTAAG